MRRIFDRTSIPERDKKEGISYAWADRLELPVIDVTHPAFKLDIDENELLALEHRALQDLKKREKVPRFVRNLFFSFLLRDSLLAKRLADARGAYLDGLGTYLFKLGPKNLGEGYAKPIDRKIAASFPGVSIRLRLKDTATLLADSLTEALASKPGATLHLVNIAGGSAADSLNCLLILRRRADLLQNRKIRIHVLDLDERGPAFAANSLTALCSKQGALEGLDADLQRVRYDWSQAKELGRFFTGLKAAKDVIASSSEGGLFEYASDDDIVENLRAVAGGVPAGTAFVGTISRTDGSAKSFYAAGNAAIRLRDLETFRNLARRAGWKVTRVVSCPLSHSLVLKKVFS